MEDGEFWFRSEERFPNLAWSRFIGRGIHAIVFHHNRLVLHDVPHRRLLQEWIPHQDGLRRCTVSPDGRWIITGGNDGKIRIWSGPNLEAELTGSLSGVSAFAMSRDGTRLVAGHANGQLVLWDMESRLEVAILQGAYGQLVDHLAFLDEDRTLMAFQRSRISLWRTE